MTEIVSREKWQEMLRRSESLQMQVRWAREDGRRGEASALERELSALTAKIRSPRLLRVKGIDA